MFCGNSFSAKRKTARFCKDSCRRDFNRDKDRVEIGEPLIEAPSEAPPKVSKEMHPIDRSWYEMRLKKGLDTLFSKEKDKKCIMCDSKFKTRLRFMKYCSAKCHPHLKEG